MEQISWLQVSYIRLTKLWLSCISLAIVSKVLAKSVLVSHGLALIRKSETIYMFKLTRSHMTKENQMEFENWI